MIYEKKHHVWFFIIIAAAVLMKGALFAYMTYQAPHVKMQYDSRLYLASAEVLINEGQYATRSTSGLLYPVTLRLPGYPLFLGLTHTLAGLSLTAVVFLQILLTLAAAGCVYLAVRQVLPGCAMVALCVMLLDPPITIFSMMLLSESVFLFFIGLFFWFFIRFLSGHQTKWLAASSVFLAAATYVRPTTLYLPAALAGFLLWHFRHTWQKAVKPVCFFLLVFYCLVGLWHVRNYHAAHKFTFTTVRSITIDAEGLLHSYERNTHKEDFLGLNPVLYYINATIGGVLDFFTYPGTLKQYQSESLKEWGKYFAYPWMVFWLTGLIAGCWLKWRDPIFQFCLLCILYFAAVSIVATMGSASGRFRIPAVPFISLISAYGWLHWRNWPCWKKA